MKENSIPYPSDTILLAKKQIITTITTWISWKGLAGNDNGDGSGGTESGRVLDQSRHNSHGTDYQVGVGSGGSNYAMTDGSARFIKYPLAVEPINMFAITYTNRTQIYPDNFRLEFPSESVRHLHCGGWIIGAGLVF